VRLPILATLEALETLPAGERGRAVSAARGLAARPAPTGVGAPPSAPSAHARTAPARPAVSTPPSRRPAARGREGGAAPGATSSHWPSPLQSLLHSSGEAWLAALAATAPGGEAPALVRQATLPAGWSLVSVPLVASNTQATSVFAALPPPQRVYDYVGGRTLGVGEPGFRGVVPGRAFWVLLEQPQTVSISGLAINPTIEARLPLAPGWNTLATPWLSGVEWADARVAVRVGGETVALSEAVTRGWIGGDLHQYLPATASFVIFASNATPAGELRVWEGSAVFASVTGELVLAPPPADTQPPTLALTPGPVDGLEVTAPLDIVGTVADPNLAEWRLELAPAGTSTFTPFALGAAPVTNGMLGTLDPTLLLNGQYQVRLVATDAFGQTSVLSWSVVVKDSLKVGSFTLSFVDLDVPLAGLPIRVTRTYDSRDKGRGDFGVGWRLELTDVRVDENLRFGDEWAGTRSGGVFPNYCLQATRNHRVSVTLPDGKLLQFEPTVTPQCQFLIPPLEVTLGFRPLPGTLGTLEPLDVTSALVALSWPGAGSLLDYGTGEGADPDFYRLTLPDGRAFVVHQRNGLQSLSDFNGNQLVVGPGGITHGSGTGVAFTRDALGRITRVTDPNGDSLTYSYDAAGDLAGVADREGHVTTFAYDGAHRLLGITDPLGRQPLRNDYDAAGRLIRQTDPSGRAIEYTHDVAGRQSVVVDRLGRARLIEYDARGNVVREVDQEGATTLRAYDARGNLLSETDALGHTTTQVWDASDNVVSATDPLGGVGEYTYNARRQLLTIRDPRGNVTTSTYDARGNLLSTTDAAGHATTYTYDARGNRTSRTDALGQVVQMTYDAAGRLVRERDAFGREATYTYDANGNRLTETRTRRWAACR
jgi:YD repeat-containing protein